MELPSTSSQGQGEDLSTPRRPSAHSQTGVLRGDWTKVSQACEIWEDPLLDSVRCRPRSLPAECPPRVSLVLPKLSAGGRARPLCR